MKIKICGITKLDQLIAIDKLGIDFAGMIFYPASPRYILNKLNSKQVAETTLKLKKVGVFVNATEEDIMTMVDAYHLDLVQLHGDETPGFCKQISNKISVLKAFRINERNEKNIDWLIKPFEEYVDFYLFDTFSKNGYGGTGAQFNWKALQDSVINKEFFLSGGIGIDDTEEIKKFRHPNFYGIDLNSKLEIQPGIKDLEKIKIISALNNHQPIIAGN